MSRCISEIMGQAEKYNRVGGRHFDIFIIKEREISHEFTNNRKWTSDVRHQTSAEMGKNHPHLNPLPSRARKQREGIATNSRIMRNRHQTSDIRRQPKRERETTEDEILK